MEHTLRWERGRRPLVGPTALTPHPQRGNAQRSRSIWRSYQ